MIVEAVEEYPSIHIYKLLHKNQDSPVICCLATLEGHRHTPKWWSIFKDSQAFIDKLRESGYVLRDDVDLITDEKTLSLWRKET